MAAARRAVIGRGARRARRAGSAARSGRARARRATPQSGQRQDGAALVAGQRGRPAADDEDGAAALPRHVLDGAGERQGERMIPEDAAGVGGDDLGPRPRAGASGRTIRPCRACHQLSADGVAESRSRRLPSSAARRSSRSRECSRGAPGGLWAGSCSSIRASSRGRRQRGQQRGARADHDAGCARGRPRTRPGGAPPRRRRCRAGRRRAARAQRAAASRSGAMTSAAPGSRSQALDEPVLAPLVRPELRRARRARARGAAGGDTVSAAPAARAAAAAARAGSSPTTTGSRRRPSVPARARPPRGPAPAPPRAAAASARRIALAEPDHHADPRPPLERRADPLPPAQPPARGHDVGERAVDRKIEDDVGDQATTSVRRLREVRGPFRAPAYGELEELDERPQNTSVRPTRALPRAVARARVVLAPRQLEIVPGHAPELRARDCAAGRRDGRWARARSRGTDTSCPRSRVMPSLVPSRVCAAKLPRARITCGLDGVDLGHQERAAGRDLVGLRVAVALGPALHHVGDVAVALAIEPDRGEHLGEELAGAAHEGHALLVLLLARGPRRPP